MANDVMPTQQQSNDALTELLESNPDAEAAVEASAAVQKQKQEMDDAATHPEQQSVDISDLCDAHGEDAMDILCHAVDVVREGPAWADPDNPYTDAEIAASMATGNLWGDPGVTYEEAVNICDDLLNRVRSLSN